MSCYYTSIYVRNMHSWLHVYVRTLHLVLKLQPLCQTVCTDSTVCMVLLHIKCTYSTYIRTYIWYKVSWNYSHYCGITSYTCTYKPVYFLQHWVYTLLHMYNDERHLTSSQWTCPHCRNRCSTDRRARCRHHPLPSPCGYLGDLKGWGRTHPQ